MSSTKKETTNYTKYRTEYCRDIIMDPYTRWALTTRQNNCEYRKDENDSPNDRGKIDRDIDDAAAVYYILGDENVSIHPSNLLFFANRAADVVIPTNFTFDDKETNND